MANAHLAAGLGTAPWLEFPFDPDGWTLERRDFLLTKPIRSDADGWLTLPEAPGLGVELDEDRLAATACEPSVPAAVAEMGRPRGVRRFFDWRRG